MAVIEAAASSKLGFVDLTIQLERAVSDSGVAEGVVIVFCRHTTCGLLINEWEDGVLQDLRERVEELVPHIYYAHDDLTRRTQNLTAAGEPANGRAHVMQMLLGGASQAVPVREGKPALGQWQRLFLVELDEPRIRQVMLLVMGGRDGGAGGKLETGQEGQESGREPPGPMGRGRRPGDDGSG